MIVATAGHVDHGKTTLVRALTGVDTDRLPQEKARGISIDIGFAYVSTAAGRTLGFVDVPGHERFVRNMLAGVCGIDAVLLVVAADDGVMPQTREHLAIVDLLAVTRGLVVISKIDCVAPDRVVHVRAQIGALLAGTGLADADIVEVSAVSGQGVPALRAWLDAATDEHVARDIDHRGARYAIDRSFSVPGSGTVVTGTMFAGTLSVGDRVVVAPAGREVRVRAIQKAGVPAASARAGERCSLNLAGAERADVARGQWIVAGDGATSSTSPTSRLDVRLRLLDDSTPLRHWSPVQLHAGTASVRARVLVPHGGTLAKGATAFVQLLCDEPVSAVVGERFIVRDVSATRTLGGGIVIDPFPPTRRVARTVRDAQLLAMSALDPARALPALLAASPGGLDLDCFGRAFNVEARRREALARQAGAVFVGRDSQWVIRETELDQLKNAVVVTLARFHAESPQAPGLELRVLRRLAAPAIDAERFASLVRRCAVELGLAVVGSVVRKTSHVTTANRADQMLWQRVKPRLLEAGFRGMLLRDLAADLRVQEPVLADFLHRQAATGDVVRVAPQRFLVRELLAQLAALATQMVEESDGHGFVAASFRDRTGVNRTVAIEILECLDRLGVTQRIGDARKIRKDFVPILGPARLPVPRPSTATARPLGNTNTHA